MKTLFILLSLSLLAAVRCADSRKTVPQIETFSSSPAFTSINGFKNGKPFINYLGTKMEGC